LAYFWTILYTSTAYLLINTQSVQFG